MLARITGTLDTLEADPDAALIDLPDGRTYRALLPAYASARLGGSLGQTVTLHTLEYLETHNQGATFAPRLAGFLTPGDLKFFELLTTVKGLGPRRALRAMVMDTAALALAVAERDLKLIQTMPEVGKKTAETIVLTLKDKVEPFLKAMPSGGAGGDAIDLGGGPTVPPGPGREAVEVLVQLGEDRRQAMQWVERIQSADDAPADADAIVAAVYALRG